MSPRRTGSFWSADDITPLRTLANDQGRTDGNRLFTPRQTHRLKLQWGVRQFDGDGKSYGPAFGVGGTIYRKMLPDGYRKKAYLDVGENPPNGVVVYYWLDAPPTDELTLCFRTATGEAIAAITNADNQEPGKRLPSKPGLNRFVWNMGYPAATKFDETLLSNRTNLSAKSRVNRMDQSLRRANIA